MSDTDDTDALLTCDPGGGISDLLGKTMDEISSQLSTACPAPAASKSTTETKAMEKSRAKVPNRKSKLCTSGNNTSKSLDTSFNVSDYFNSDGELVLSGISQFSETSSAFYDLNQSVLKGLKVSSSSGENADHSNSSDNSSTSTVESNTVVPSTSKPQEVGKSSDERKNDDGQKIRNDKQCEGSSLSSAIAKIDNSETVPKDIQSELKRQLFQANSSNPEAQSILEENSSHISYGVLNLNLNDLKTFAEGLSLCNFFPASPSPKVSTYVPTRNDKGEQIFVRAPNFRTPGGYKPPRHTRKCRDLTDEQIREEVRKMYAFPDADEDSNGDSEKQKSTDLKPDNGEKTSSADKLKVDFNFLDGSPIPSEFGKGKSGKSIKRKLLPNGGNICGGTVGSIPDLGFGLRTLSSDEVKEPLIEKSVTWTTGQESKEGVNPKHNNNLSTISSSISRGFSFGFGEQNTFSPIKPTVEPSCSKQENSVLFESQRMLPSPDKKLTAYEANSEKKESSVSSCKTEKEPTPAVSAEESVGKISSGEQESSATNGVRTVNAGNSKNKPLTPKRRLFRKAATKHRGMASSKSLDSNNISLPMDSIAADLEKILSEIDIPSEELESLIENFEDTDSEPPGPLGFFEGIDTIDGNLVDALSQLKLDNCQPSSTAKFSEKYHDERVKREQCEKELRNLQERFLVEKQQNAVLEGTLKRRNVLLVQITVAFNRVCKEWKRFDEENKSAVNKLQHDQKILATACKHSRERISQYEKELHKTLEMADSFKSKLNDVQSERDASILLLKENNNELEEKINKLKVDMDLLKNERDATLRALREAQIKLDEGKFSMDNMGTQLKEFENRDLEHIQKYEELLHAKNLQDSTLQDVMTRKADLENMVVNLRTQLELEKSSKDQLKKTIQEEAERKTRMEAERLHEYYNKKVQEILKAATEEASAAESLLKDQMRRASVESDRRLAEYKERYSRELDALRAKYEAEIDKLKRENLHKQLLISSTVKQLQLGESTNLDSNTAAVNSSRISHNKKDLLDVLKSQTCQGSENIYKASGITNLTKFTLDHLPSIVPVGQQHQGVVTNKDSVTGQQGELAFESGKAFVRYKTSTPIDSQVEQRSREDANASGDCRRATAGSKPAYSDGNIGNSRPDSEKVCSEKLVNSESTPDYTDFKNVLSHLLEAPVKPEKEQLQMSNMFSNNVKPPENAGLDPALQKCIQDLLKSYSDKVNNDSGKNGVGTVASAMSVRVGVGNNNTERNDMINKNDNECSNNNTDSQQSSGSTSENLTSQLSSKSDSRSKSKTKNEVTLSQQQQSQSSAHLKPPWK